MGVPPIPILVPGGQMVSEMDFDWLLISVYNASDSELSSLGVLNLSERLVNDNRHHKLVVPLKEEIGEAWGLGSVWKTCCGTIYGIYFDEESNKYVAMYLGKDKEAAVGRMNHVKSFIM